MGLMGGTKDSDVTQNKMEDTQTSGVGVIILPPYCLIYLLVLCTNIVNV